MVFTQYQYKPMVGEILYANDYKCVYSHTLYSEEKWCDQMLAADEVVVHRGWSHDIYKKISRYT